MYWSKDLMKQKHIESPSKNGIGCFTTSVVFKASSHLWFYWFILALELLDCLRQKLSCTMLIVWYIVGGIGGCYIYNRESLYQMHLTTHSTVTNCGCKFYNNYVIKVVQLKLIMHTDSARKNWLGRWKFTRRPKSTIPLYFVKSLLIPPPLPPILWL